MPWSIIFALTLQTEILSTEIADFLKRMIILILFNSVLNVTSLSKRTVSMHRWLINDGACTCTFTWRDVVLTSMRRDDVASTSIRRHFCTICPRGYTSTWNKDPTIPVSSLIPYMEQMCSHTRRFIGKQQMVDLYVYTFLNSLIFIYFAHFYLGP